MGWTRLTLTEALELGKYLGYSVLKLKSVQGLCVGGKEAPRQQKL